MADFARQLRALGFLLARHWTRRAVKLGAAPTQKRVPAFLLLSVVWSGYMGNLIWQVCARSARDGDLRLSVVRWQLDGILLYAMATASLELSPEIGRVRAPLRAAILDELPILPSVRVALFWLRNPILAGLVMVALFAWTPEQRGLHPYAYVVLGLVVYASATLCGLGLVGISRVVLPAHWRRSAAITGIIANIAGIVVVMIGRSLAPLRLAGDPMLHLARAIVAGKLLAPTLALVGIGVVAGLVVAASELVGYDRLDAAAPRVRRARGALSSGRAVEWRLFWRQGGAALYWFGWLLVAAALVATVIIERTGAPHLDSAEARQLALFTSGGFAYLGVLFSLNLASNAARRDFAARELLAPLPLSPYDTLADKARTLRRLLLPSALAFLVAIGWTLWHTAALDGATALTLGWRTALTLLGLHLGADAAVSVAFLSNGLGTPRAVNLGAPTSFATQLLLLPLLAAATAPNAFVAATSVATLAALTFEARRAARRCVRWLDDAATDLERDTEVWRALIVLAAFFAAQALTAPLLHASGVSPGRLMTATYGVGALVLVALTATNRERRQRLRLWPSATAARRWALPLGVVGGALSGLSALALARVVTKLGWLPTGREESPLGDAPIALFVTLAIVAPLAEETFFRGWLQDAIARELTPSRRRWAFALGAVAFAAAHLGSLVLPQLVLGAIAGALFAWSGALLPGMVAHAMHNAIVLLAGS